MLLIVDRRSDRLSEKTDMKWINIAAASIFLVHTILHGEYRLNSCALEILYGINSINILLYLFDFSEFLAMPDYFSFIRLHQQISIYILNLF